MLWMLLICCKENCLNGMIKRRFLRFMVAVTVVALERAIMVVLTLAIVLESLRDFSETTRRALNTLCNIRVRRQNVSIDSIAIALPIICI